MLSTNKRILSILGLSLSLTLFNSCGNKDKETTVEEDKQNVEELFDNVVEQAEDLKNGCGMRGVDNFFNIENGEALNQAWADDITRALENALDYSYVDQTRQFDFNRHTGTYNWDGGMGMFMRTSTPNDKVVVMAPARMGQSTNNATATIGGYTQQSTMFDGARYYLPNTAEMNVAIDGQECLALKLEEAKYDVGTFMMPISMKMMATMAPFNFEIESEKVDGNTFDMDITAKNDGSEKFSIKGDFTFADNDFSDVTSEDVEKAVGEFTFGDFTMPFDVNIKALQDLLNPSQTQINEMIKVTVEYKGKKIADLEFQDASTETIIIVYKDGTREDLYTEYEDLVSRLEVVFSDFFFQ